MASGSSLWRKIAAGTAALMLCACLPACGAATPEPLEQVASPTPYPFVTATPAPTATPVTPTATPTPFATSIPTPTDIPPTEPVTETPTPTDALDGTPTIDPAVTPACPEMPDGAFRFVYETVEGLPGVMGCPTTPDGVSEVQAWPVDIRYQPMEHGYMLWLSNVGWYEGRVVVVLIDDGTHARYDDTYIAGVDRASGGPTPPEGLFQPVENLGKVWRIIPGLIERIGFGTEPEIRQAAQMQLTQYGEMVYLAEQRLMFVMWRAEPDTWRVYSLAE